MSPGQTGCLPVDLSEAGCLSSISARGDGGDSFFYARSEFNGPQSISPTGLLTSGNLIRYVEPLRDARAMLADFFSILRVVVSQEVGCSCSERQ